MEIKSNAPVFYQIAEAIKKQIFNGEYLPGSKIPSIRELGVRLKINPNTIVHVYELLENEGYIYTASTNGKFIIDDREKLEELKKTYLKEKTGVFIQDMTECGLSVEDIIGEIKRYEQ